MPPLSAMSISTAGQQTTGVPAEPTQYSSSNLGQSPSLSPPQEPQIQAWASNTVAPQQPKPIIPVGRWTPHMGIKFGAPGSGTVQPPPPESDVGPGKKDTPGAWDPSYGIQFS